MAGKKGINLREKNGQWKGDKVGIVALHAWVKRRLIKPKICPNCGRKDFIELFCKNHEYSRDLSRWGYVCRSCHSTFDGKIKNITENYKEKECPECGIIISTRRNYCKECARKIRLNWWKIFNKKRRSKH